MSDGSTESHDQPAPDAFDWLAEYGDALFRYAMTRQRDEAAAEDLVQETLLAAISAWHSFRGDSSVQTWLIGILRRKIIDHMRRSGRAAAALDESALGLADDRVFSAFGKWRNPPGSWSQSADVGDPEFQRVLRSCLDDLPDAQREAMLLRERNEVSAQELSKIMGVSPTNIHVILHRARMSIRSCLEKKWFVGGR